MVIADSRTHVPLAGSERQPAPDARDIGPVDPDESMAVTIYLRPRTAAGELAAQAAAMGARPPGERTYLTPNQYTALYGADPRDIEKVVAFGRHHDLRVVSTSLAARTVAMSGTAHAMEAAFHVELRQYSGPHCGPYRGYAGSIQIPVELRHVIEGVFGLDNREQASWMPGGAATRESAAAESAQRGGAVSGKQGTIPVTALATMAALLVVLAALILLPH